MIFERIKAIKPQKFDVKNGDDAYAEYIGKLPTHAHAGNLFAIIGTVAAAVTVVIGVSLWAIIGSGVRGTPPEDSVTIPAADTDGEDYIIKIKTAATLYASADGEVCGITPTNQKEARELANIIKNAEYKKTDCDCYGDCHVFFGDTTKAQYMIITNHILTAVHIKSQEGECQFNKAQSARIIELLKMVVTKQNRCFTVTSDIGKQYRSFIKKPYTVEERLGNPVTVMYGDDYVSTFSFDNADAKALRNMLESFEYDKPKCECFPSFSVAYDYLREEYDDTGFDYKYSIIFERDSKNVHVCDRSGRHTLTKAEQNKLLGILFRQMAADNPSSSYMLDIVLPEYTDPVDVTCNGKTVALPDADIQSVTAYFLTFATYSADFCKCDKTYATFKIKGSEYSFCTCDEPRLTAPCGSRRVDQSVIDALRNKTDKLFKTESPSAKPQESQTNNTKPPVTTPTKQDKSIVLGDADIDKIGFKEAYKEKPNLCDDIELPILDTTLLSNSTKKIELDNTLTEQILESVIKKYKIQLMPTFVMTESPGLSTYRYLIALGMDVSTIEAANKSAAELFGYDNIFTILPETFNTEKSYDYNNVVIDSAYSYKTKDGHSCYSIEFYRKEYEVPTRFTLTYTGKSITEPDIFFEHNIFHEVTSDFTRENYTPMLVDLTGLKISISGNGCTFVGQPDINSRINRAVKNGGALVKFVKKGDSIGYDNGHGIIDIFDTPIEITAVYCGNLKKGDVVSLVRKGGISSDNSIFYVETVDSIKPTPLLQDGVEYFGLLYYNDNYSVDGFASFVGNAYTEVANILQNSELSEAYDKYR